MNKVRSLPLVLLTLTLIMSACTPKPAEENPAPIDPVSFNCASGMKEIESGCIPFQTVPGQRYYWASTKTTSCLASSASRAISNTLQVTTSQNDTLLKHPEVLSCEYGTRSNETACYDSRAVLPSISMDLQPCLAELGSTAPAPQSTVCTTGGTVLAPIFDQQTSELAGNLGYSCEYKTSAGNNPDLHQTTVLTPSVYCSDGYHISGQTCVKTVVGPTITMANFTLTDLAPIRSPICPVKVGSFPAGNVTYVNQSGATVNLSALPSMPTIGFMLQNSTTACLTNSNSYIWFQNSVVAEGDELLSPQLRAKFTPTDGGDPIYSSPFTITFSRKNDNIGLVTTTLITKFINLVTSLSADQSTGVEVFNGIDQISMNFTVRNPTENTLTTNTIIDPSNSSRVTTTLTTTVVIPDEGTEVVIPKGTPALTKELRRNIWTSDLKFNLTNSSNATFNLTSPELRFKLENSTDVVQYPVSFSTSLEPGSSRVVEFKSGFRGVLRSAGNMLGEKIANYAIRFGKKMNQGPFDKDVSLVNGDVLNHEETLTATQLPRFFHNGAGVESAVDDDLYGVRDGSIQEISQAYTASELISTQAKKKNTTVKIGNKEFFMTSRRFNSNTETVLMYYDHTVGLPLAQRVKSIQLNIPGANDNCQITQTPVSYDTCHSAFYGTGMMIFPLNGRLLVVKDITTSYLSNHNRRTVGVFNIDPANLGDPNSNFFTNVDSSNANPYNHTPFGLGFSNIYFNEVDSLLAISGREEVYFYNLATNIATRQIHTQGLQPTKFIRVAPLQYIVGPGYPSDIKTSFVDLDFGLARFISISNNPTGANTCVLVGGARNSTSGVKASFVCQFPGGKNKLMKYTEGVSPAAYRFETVASIRSDANDFPNTNWMSNSGDVITLANGNAVVRAYTGSSGSNSAFYLVTHTEDSGEASVKMTKIALTGNVADPIYASSSVGGYVVNGNKIYMHAQINSTDFVISKYDDDTKQIKVLANQSDYNGTFNNVNSSGNVFIDESGNVLIRQTLIKSNDTVMLPIASGYFLPLDLANGVILYADSKNHFVWDSNKNYQFQIEDINDSFADPTPNLNSAGGQGRLFGSGAMFTAKVKAYGNKVRTFNVDLTGIQPK